MDNQGAWVSLPVPDCPLMLIYERLAATTGQSESITRCENRWSSIGKINSAFVAQRKSDITPRTDSIDK